MNQRNKEADKDTVNVKQTKDKRTVRPVAFPYSRESSGQISNPTGTMAKDIKGGIESHVCSRTTASTLCMPVQRMLTETRFNTEDTKRHNVCTLSVRITYEASKQQRKNQ